MLVGKGVRRRIVGMHRIDDVIVHNGKLVLANLPFAEGQRVRVVVDVADDTPIAGKISIHEARRLLRGSVVRYDDPFEPVLEFEEWEPNE